LIADKVVQANHQHAIQPGSNLENYGSQEHAEHLFPVDFTFNLFFLFSLLVVCENLDFSLVTSPASISVGNLVLISFG
jgi:hypothetical protein